MIINLTELSKLSKEEQKKAIKEDAERAMKSGVVVTASAMEDWALNAPLDKDEDDW